MNHNFFQKLSNLAVSTCFAVTRSTLLIRELNHLWRHIRRFSDYYFGKRVKPRMDPAPVPDFEDRYLENERRFLKNNFETVFWGPNSIIRNQLVKTLQLTFKIKIRIRKWKITLGTYSRPFIKQPWGFLEKDLCVLKYIECFNWPIPSSIFEVRLIDSLTGMQRYRGNYDLNGCLQYARVRCLER